jgi:hypothetical protein
VEGAGCCCETHTTRMGTLWTGAWPTQPAITQAVNRRGERGPSLYSNPVVSIGPLFAAAAVLRRRGRAPRAPQCRLSREQQRNPPHVYRTHGLRPLKGQGFRPFYLDVKKKLKNWECWLPDAPHVKKQIDSKGKQFDSKGKRGAHIIARHHCTGQPLGTFHSTLS